MRKILIVFLMATLAAPSTAWAGADPFVGEVETFGFGFCPRGWAPLNGQIIAISQNTALFALLGTKYGGNGTSNFALPTGKPVLTLTQGAPLIQCIALQGVFPAQN